MAVFLIIMGLVLGGFGACTLVQAAIEPHATRQVGGLAIGAALALPGIVMLIVGIKRAGRPKTDRGNTRKCPHCAEMIKPDATVCRHCQRDVPVLDETTPVGLGDRATPYAPA